MPHLITKINLMVGWNTIGWPITAPAITNEAFLEDLAMKGFTPVAITRWFGGRWVVHDYQSQANIWIMESGQGYQVRVAKAGPYEMPGGALAGHEHDCPPKQFWDAAQAKCVPDTRTMPIFDISFLTDWVRANPVIAGIGIAGALFLLSGGIRIGRH